MDIERYITKEDFLKLKSLPEGGTLINGRRYSVPQDGNLSAKSQSEKLGRVDKTGEGIIDRVFFFEVLKDPLKESWELKDIDLQMVSAKVVDHYVFVSEQEALKEIALTKAKIVLRDKEILRGKGEEENDKNDQN